jgi:hypothetical protein
MVFTLKGRVRLTGRMTDADFRPNTTLVESATSGFMLRRECTCAGCMGQIRRGDRARYVDNLICHIGCNGSPIPGGGQTESGTGI